jgi:hypothetical protein
VDLTMPVPFDREKPPPAYFRDADDFLYVNAEGVQYIVREGAGPEPRSQATPLPMSDDAEPITLGAHDRELFERTRIAYGIRARAGRGCIMPTGNIALTCNFNSILTYVFKWGRTMKNG